MAAIRVENQLGEQVPIQKGVRQGCVLSPDLFNLYSEKIMSTVQDLEGHCTHCWFQWKTAEDFRQSSTGKWENGTGH